MKFIEDDVGPLDTGRPSEYTRNSVTSLNKKTGLQQSLNGKGQDLKVMPQLSRHGHAKSMIENLKNISRKRSNVNFSQILDKTKNKENMPRMSSHIQKDGSLQLKKVET